MFINKLVKFDKAALKKMQSNLLSIEDVHARSRKSFPYWLKVNRLKIESNLMKFLKKTISEGHSKSFIQFDIYNINAELNNVQDNNYGRIIYDLSYESDNLDAYNVPSSQYTNSYVSIKDENEFKWYVEQFKNYLSNDLELKVYDNYEVTNNFGIFHAALKISLDFN